MQATTTEMAELKAKLKVTWNTGDYGVMARDLEASAEAFYADFAVPPGAQVLDVACGTGQIALPAARAGARVTGLDIAPASIAQARSRVAREGLPVVFDEGDAEDMPYGDARFDLVISLIGAMFAPRPDHVAAELKRVCRPGGHIVMGNWTPEGFIGRMFKTIATYAPPSPLMPSPLLWGVEQTVRERLENGTDRIDLRRRMHTFRYPFEPREVVCLYVDHFGPIMRALATLGERDRITLLGDLERLWEEYNEGAAGTTVVEAEILEVVCVRSDA